LLVILMDVAELTQWGSSWRRERVCGRGGIRKNCGNLWKSQKHISLKSRYAGHAQKQYTNFSGSGVCLPHGQNEHRD
jgi:hypothetical protein